VAASNSTTASTTAPASAASPAVRPRSSAPFPAADPPATAPAVSTNARCDVSAFGSSAQGSGRQSAELTSDDRLFGAQIGVEPSTSLDLGAKFKSPLAAVSGRGAQIADGRAFVSDFEDRARIHSVWIFDELIGLRADIEVW
jgi:hypothetical protein